MLSGETAKLSRSLLASSFVFVSLIGLIALTLGGTSYVEKMYDILVPLLSYALLSEATIGEKEIRRVLIFGIPMLFSVVEGVLYFFGWNFQSELRSYASIAVGGLLVIALITLALGTYGNRVAIYTAPVLAGLVAYIIAPRLRGIKLAVSAFTLIIALSLMGLVFSGSTIYWDYSAGNPISYVTLNIIYDHYDGKLTSYYTTGWFLAQYIIVKHNYIKLTSNNLVLYNKDDLLYLANDVSTINFDNAVRTLNSSSDIIFNDGFNIFCLAK